MGNTRERLTAQMERVSDDIREYVRQLESGEYGNRWLVQSYDDPVDHNYDDIIAGSESDALAIAQKRSGQSHDNWEVDRDSFDEPTLVDDYGNEARLSEYPLEVVDERGRQFAVVISTGGPHIEVTADGDQRAYLVGYWGGEKVTSHGDHFDTFLDYFIER